MTTKKIKFSRSDRKKWSDNFRNWFKFHELDQKFKLNYKGIIFDDKMEYILLGDVYFDDDIGVWCAHAIGADLKRYILEFDCKTDWNNLDDKIFTANPSILEPKIIDFDFERDHNENIETINVSLKRLYEELKHCNNKISNLHRGNPKSLKHAKKIIDKLESFGANVISMQIKNRDARWINTK